MENKCTTVEISKQDQINEDFFKVIHNTLSELKD